MVVASPLTGPPIFFMNETLWCEKYRPQTIDQCILPPALKGELEGFIKNKELPNLLFTGTSGLGKTTAARALCNELDLDHILINASEDNGIDVLRTRIRQFASTVSFSGGHKVVILDEADHLNPSSTQPALRGFIEEFSGNCRFIFTCNFKNRIIEALHSRTSVVSFNTNKKSLASLAGKFLIRLEDILQQEKTGYDKNVLIQLIMMHAPDWRRVLNECQRHGSQGDIGSNILVGVSDQNVAKLITSLKGKDFKGMRSWVSSNSSLDGNVTFRAIYDSLSSHAAPEAIPQAILILAEYGYKSSFMADKELNIVACLIELMSSVKWK